MQRPGDRVIELGINNDKSNNMCPKMRACGSNL